MNAPTRPLVALLFASNLMGCQLIKKFTNRDSGAATGTTVMALDGSGMALPSEYDGGAAANAAMAAANAAMANAADASAQAGQAMQNAQNALADASANTAVLVPSAAVESDGGGAMAAPPGVAPTPAGDPAAPVAVVQPTPTAPGTPSEVADDPRRPTRHRSVNYCLRHPGQLDPRTGQICPNVLGSQNLQR